MFIPECCENKKEKKSTKKSLIVLGWADPAQIKEHYIWSLLTHNVSVWLQATCRNFLASLSYITAQGQVSMPKLLTGCGFIL